MAIILSSRASMWLKRSCGRVYAAHIKENIPHGFRLQVFVMRLTGLLPTTNDPPWYKWLTIVFFCSVGILLPWSQLVNIVFVQTIPAAMHHSFLPLNFWATAFKAAVIHYRRDDIRQLFRIHDGLWRATGCGRKIDVNIREQIATATLYLMTWLAVVVQSVLSESEDAMLPSTAHWPYDFAQAQAVYWIVLTLQIAISVGYIIWAAVGDLFYIGTINTACGHITQLNEQLKCVGTEIVTGEDLDLRFYKDLVECCRQYEDCLR